MSKTVIDAFNTFLKENINLEPEHSKKAKASREWLINQILGFPLNDKEFPEIYSEKNISYGSFSRRTKTRPLDDIDLMICLKGQGCTYGSVDNKILIYVPDTPNRYTPFVNEGTNILNSRKIINRFVQSLSQVTQYKKAEIKRNLEAATLSLESYDWVFDIVPCFLTALDIENRTFYIIPDGAGNWKKTDPRLDSERANKVNSQHSGKVLNVIRIVKFWNKRATMPSMSSYLIENIILDYYEQKIGEASEFVDIELPGVFSYIAKKIYGFVKDPKGIQGDLNDLDFDERKKIAERAQNDSIKALNARQLEGKGLVKESINEWKIIFGEQFPNFG